MSLTLSVMAGVRHLASVELMRIAGVRPKRPNLQVNPYLEGTSLVGGARLKHSLTLNELGTFPCVHIDLFDLAYFSEVRNYLLDFWLSVH